MKSLSESGSTTRSPEMDDDKRTVDLSPLSNLTMPEEIDEAFAAIVEALPAAIVVIQDGRVCYMNPFAQQHLGVNTQEARGMDLWEQISPEKREEVKKGVQSCLEGGQGLSRDEVKFTMRNKDERVAELSTVPIVYRQRSAVLLFLHDVTKERASREALEESERKFRDLAEKALVGIFIIQDGKFRYVNPRFAQVLGYEPEEMIETFHHEDTLLPEDRGAAVERFRKHVSGEIYHAFRVVTKQGEARNAEVFGSRTVYGGKPAVIGTLMDITERREAEGKLRRSEASLRALIGSINDVIMLVDKKGGFARLNLENPDMLNASLSSPFEKHLKEAIPREKVAPFLAAVRNAIETGSTVHIEYHMGTDGGERYFSTAISPVSEELAVSIVRDITDLKIAENELRAKSLSLNEANNALKLLLHSMEVAKKELEEAMASNIKILIMPHIRELRKLGLAGAERVHMDAIEAGLRNISSSFIRDLSQFNLTHKELEVARLVKDGRTTKEIIELINGTKDSVDRHRYHIRKKLGINKSRTNLRSYLLSLR